MVLRLSTTKPTPAGTLRINKAFKLEFRLYRKAMWMMWTAPGAEYEWFEQR